jgi:hypothetical protein
VGVGVGVVIVRVPAGTPGLAWVRHGSEFYLPCGIDFFLSQFLAFVRFLAVFLFPPLSRTIPYKLDIRVFRVYPSDFA